MNTTALRPDWLTPAEIASMFDLTRRAIERACRRGDIVAFRVGGRWLIPRTSLLEALNPAVTPAMRDDLQEATAKGRPRQRRPMIRNWRTRKKLAESVQQL